MPRTILKFATGLVWAVLSGCASYTPAPLSDGRGAQTLDMLTMPSVSTPLLPTHRFDVSDGIDETETAMLAVVNNPDLRVQRDALGIAKSQSFAAGLLPDPRLSLTRELPTSDQRDLTSAFSLGLSEDIGALLVRSSATEAARRATDKVRLDLLWSEWQTIARARLLFGKVIALRAQARRLGSEVVALRPIDQRVKEALVAGNLTYEGASAGLDAMAEARRRLAETTRQRDQAEADLRGLLGLNPQAPLRLTGGSHDVAPSPEQIRRELDSLPQRRPDLLALKAGYAAQESKLRAAIIAQFPAITLGFTRARDTSNVYTSGFALDIALPLFDRNRGAIAIETATRQKLRDEYQARLFAARGDAWQLQQDLASLEAQFVAQRMHARQLDAARSAAERAWRAHLLDWPTYLSIRSHALGADLDLAALRQERSRQAIALETMLGRDATTAHGTGDRNPKRPSRTRHQP